MMADFTEIIDKKAEIAILFEKYWKEVEIKATDPESQILIRYPMFKLNVAHAFINGVNEGVELSGRNMDSILKKRD